MEASRANTTTLAKSYKLVTHQNPDTDAYACLWAVQRFVIEEEATSSVVFADEQLTAEEAGDSEVLYLDACGGDLDQHLRSLERGSSFELVCERYGLLDDPGIQVILEMTRAADNDERLPPDSLHHVLSGLRRYFTDAATKKVDWENALPTAYMLLDSLYGQTLSRHNFAKEFAKIEDKVTFLLSNGLRLVVLFNNGRLKEAARNAGADVVLVTNKVPGGFNQFYVCIQVGHDVDLKLDHVVSSIRSAEARRRLIPAEEWSTRDLQALGGDRLFGGWYYHDSRRLLVCGTKKHDLIEGEHTRLNPRELADLLKEWLAVIFYNRR